MALFDNYPFKTQPFKHQRDTLELTAEKLAWAYFMEMGTGKSKIIIDNFCYLYLQGKIDTVVYIAKKGEYANFVYDQLPQHLPEGIKTEVYMFSALTHSRKSNVLAFRNFLKVDKSRLRVFVINVESLIAVQGKASLESLYKTKPTVYFALDESTCAKNTDAKRSKEVYGWAAKSHYRRIMTGTAVTNSPLDLFGQSLVLGKGILGHTSFYSFRGVYAEMETIYLGQRAIKKVSRYRNLDKLGAVLKTFSTQILREECVDLPPKIYKKLYVEMTPKQQKLYDTLRDEAIIEFEQGSLEVTNILTQIIKLHQIACGQLKLDDQTYVSVENNRIPALLDVLEDYEGKVLIWANYRQTLQDVLKALREVYGDEAVVGYYGGVPDAVRQAAVKNFQDPNHPLRFFVANPQSAGFGLTLTQARLCIYYSNSYNLEHRLQSEDRAHRIGQTGSVTYIDLVSHDTVDERIIQALRDKKNIATEVMGNNWKKWI